MNDKYKFLTVTAEEVSGTTELALTKLISQSAVSERLRVIQSRFLEIHK